MDREVEKAFMNCSKEMFAAKTKPSTLVANQVGNMYTPSLTVLGGHFDAFWAPRDNFQGIQSLVKDRVEVRCVHEGPLFYFPFHGRIT